MLKMEPRASCKYLLVCFFFRDRISFCIAGQPRTHYVAEVVPNSWQSICLNLQSSGIVGVSYYTLLNIFFDVQFIAIMQGL